MAVTPTKDTNNIIPTMQYVINGDNLPLIDNQVEMLISKWKEKEQIEIEK